MPLGPQSERKSSHQKGMIIMSLLVSNLQRESEDLRELERFLSQYLERSKLRQRLTDTRVVPAALESERSKLVASCDLDKLQKLLDSTKKQVTRYRKLTNKLLTSPDQEK